MGKDCLEILKGMAGKPLHKKLIDLGAKEGDINLFKEAAKKLQSQNLDQLNNIYADNKIEGYKRIEATANNVNDVKPKGLNENLKSKGFESKNNGVYEKDGVRFTIENDKVYEVNNGEPLKYNANNTEKSIVIDNIENIGAKSGVASKLLDEIIQAANEEGKELQLFPRPPKGGKLNKQQLTDWYKRKGFEVREDGIMVKKPTTDQSTQASPQKVKLSDLPERAFAVGMGKDEADAMREELGKNGFTQPIIIDKESGNVLDGQHRLMIADEMGIKEVPAIYMDNPSKTELNAKIKELEEKYKPQPTQASASTVSGKGVSDVAKVLNIPTEEANVLSMLHESKLLTSDEKRILYKQYKNGVMSENDISKYTNIDVADLQNGNMKWAQVILDKTKGKKIEAEDIDFEEVPTQEVKAEGGDKTYITDRNDEPLVVYHGAKGGKEIENFDLEEGEKNRKEWTKELGIHFGSAENERALSNTGGKPPSAYRLKFTRELRLEDEADRYFPLTRMTVADFVKLLPEDVQRHIDKSTFKKGDYNEEIRNALLKEGYDVLQYKNYLEDNGEYNYIALDTKNIEKVKAEQPTVLEGEGVKEVPKQQKVNDLVDRVNTFNKMAKNAKGRNEEINSIRIAANELGLKFDDRGGRLLNENNKPVQKRNTDAPAKLAEGFDENTYSPETREHINTIKGNVGSLVGLEITSNADGRSLSKSQRESAVKSIIDGKPTNGAKAIYDFIEKAVQDGGVEMIDKTTGRMEMIPISEYFKAFKEEPKPLTDEEINNLNWELTEDSFKTEEYGQENIFGEAEQTTQRTTATDTGKLISTEKTT